MIALPRFGHDKNVLHAIADSVDVQAALASRAGQCAELAAIANRLREYADSTTPGGLRLCTCGGGRWAPFKERDGDD